MKTWRTIQEEKVTASYGLATDEFLMNQQMDESNKYPATLRLYTYKNYSALAGRFQDIKAEIDIEACKALGFDYGRRLTGGGAIIMGESQLGICLATSSKEFKWQNIRELYTLFSKPIIDALSTLGVEASFRSKNDLEVNGKKIAGLGVHVSPEGAIQFHTSLLVDLNIEDMLKVLKIPIQKYSDKKKISTVEQRITTIRRETGKYISLEEVIDSIKKAFEKQFKISFDEIPVFSEEQTQINNLEKSRYLSEDWIYQHSPQDDMTGMSLKKTPAGLLRTYIGLKGETIKSVMITGDFFDQAELLALIETKLKWGPLDKVHIEKVVNRQIKSTGGGHHNLSANDIVDAIWLAGQRALAANRYTYQGSCYYPDEDKVEKNKSDLINPVTEQQSPVIN